MADKSDIGKVSKPTVMKIEEGKVREFAKAIKDRNPLYSDETMAKAYCSDAFRQVTANGIQVHGGIGFTWEHDMHIYFKRAKGSEVTFGDATWNRELVAQYTLDVPPPAEMPAA